MQFPKLPDWSVYAAVVAALWIAASGRQERADAPPAPPPVPGEKDVPISPGSPFAPAKVLEVPGQVETNAGTAFSLGEHGLWLTARHVVDGCARTAIIVADGRGVAARVKVSTAVRGDVAILATEGGSAALPLAGGPGPRRGDRAFHPGFPQGGPGEAASRLLGETTLRARGRGARAQPVLAWAEVGRTDRLEGGLAGLSGAPALDAGGRVVGVTIAESPRRGRIYTTTPAALTEALAAAKAKAAPFAVGEAITTDNYGRVADGLRRDLRVAQVVCLAG